MQPNHSLLDTLLELQILDRVPRSGWMLRGVTEPESVAEHSWHVAFLVWILGREVEGLDVLRAVELAMIHDLAEVRLGDLPRTASRYLPRGVKHEAEGAALLELLASRAGLARELYEEYRRGETREARFVTACDKLQLMIKATVYESWGTGALAEFWENPANFPDDELAPVRDLFEALRRRRGEAPDPSLTPPPSGR
jgi:putative hydrolase of HD superfamily